MKVGDKVKVTDGRFVVCGDTGEVVNPAYSPTSVLVKLTDGRSAGSTYRFYHSEIMPVEEVSS